MKRGEHKSVEAARRELSAHGFCPLFSPPGTPTHWKRPKQKTPVYLIERRRRARSTVFDIVPSTQGPT